MNETSAAVDALIADLAKERVDEAAGALPGVWSAMEELGLSTVGVDEASGGSGGTLVDTIDLARSLGTHAVSSPLIEHATARWVLAAAGYGAEGLITVAVDGGVVLGSGSARGLLEAVPWARHAQSLLVVGTDETAVIDLRSTGVTIQPYVNEAGEPRDSVTLEGAVARVVEPPPSGVSVRNRLGVLWAAALAGAMSGAYQVTRRYVREREQFGAPLIRIPAVAANLATIKAELIQTEAALDRARAAVAGELDSQRTTAAVGAARVVAARAATTTARLSHQLHGAMGITAEYPLHRHTTRLWAWRDEESSEHDWSVLLGELACADGEETVWQLMTA